MNELTTMINEVEKHQIGGLDVQSHANEDSGIEDRPKTPGQNSPTKSIISSNSPIPVYKRQISSVPFEPPKHQLFKLVAFCTHCERGYSSRESYELHQENFHSNKLCQICGDFHQGILGLKQHVEVRHII
jgi:hypothetical protein